MSGRARRSGSIYDIRYKQRKESETILDKKIHLSGKILTVGIILGVFLTIVTLILLCIALFTPHWKEISPNTHSLYVDGVDALIRTEVLTYFTFVHRFTRHSYGLFQRCEYFINNASKLPIERQETLNILLNKQKKKCTKNYLPSYDDEHFNECHSLEYYRFCSKTNEKNFDINNDYLRAAFGILSNSPINLASTFSCDCHYPTYIKACHILGIFAICFVFLTIVLYAIFPFLRTTRDRLKVKCFGVLSSILSTLFIIITLSIVLKHLEYESTEYLVAIERHYKLSEIYKLSQDTKLAIDRFQSSISIHIGYSTILAWIAFALSIVDGILLMVTCKIKHDHNDRKLIFTALHSDTSLENYIIKNADNLTSTDPLMSTTIATDSQLPPPPPPPPPLEPPTIVISSFDEEPKSPSCLKHSLPLKAHFEDESS